MNVYIESNFVLEQALEQEQSESCHRLLSLSAAGSIHMVIPAFSLAEPYITVMHKGNERSKLGAELRRQLSELGRSKPYRDASSSFNELIALLIESAEGERAGLKRAIESILKTAEVIPLDFDMFHRAEAIQTAFDMSIQDSIVLASVVHHLNENKPAKSCFLNRNTKDFDDPNVRDMLEEFGCKFFGRFDNGLRFVEAQLRNASQ